MIKQIFLSSSHARLRYWTAILLFLIILVLGSLPGARQEIARLASGVVLHATAYAGLTLLLFTGSRGTLAQRAVKSLLTIAVMGALDEYVQSFFPYRHGAVSDWLVDCSAAVLATLIMYLLWSRYRIRSSD